MSTLELLEEQACADCIRSGDIDDELGTLTVSSSALSHGRSRLRAGLRPCRVLPEWWHASGDTAEHVWGWLLAGSIYAAS